VNFFDFKTNCLKSLEKEQIVKGYRETVFTGIHSCLILSVIFRFNLVEIKVNPIAERYKWSKEFQDYSAPNCGSVFKEADNNILKRLKGLSIGKARFSPKTTNWILNNSNSSMPILALIAVAKLLHFIIGKKAITEIVIVD
jgi:UDP-N-acetylmuramate dehydrogenase